MALLLEALHEERQGEQIGCAARTQPARDERRMHLARALPPRRNARATLREEVACRLAREAQARRAAPMQQVGILDSCNQREAGFTRAASVSRGALCMAWRSAGSPSR